MALSTKAAAAVLRHYEDAAYEYYNRDRYSTREQKGIHARYERARTRMMARLMGKSS